MLFRMRHACSALTMLTLITFGCATRSPVSPYPTHWWTPVSTQGAPEWEILPQAAGPGEVILSKRHELGLLSNFAATPFEYRGKRYASVEGFWQSLLYPESKDDPRAKTKGLTWPQTRAEVEQMVAFDAKRAGGPAKENMQKLGIDWVTFEGKRMLYRSPTPGEHYQLIRDVLRAKARQNPAVMRVLFATRDLKLKPDHFVAPDSPPAWKYHEIWMDLRKEFTAPEP
ncbi:MAG: NADAR family protein [Bdellovibrionaceae bacterium]|nr:NADAR family protein [Pseudobdellovibrionaceae bacterium]